MNNNDLVVNIRRSQKKPISIVITHKPSGAYVAGKGIHETRLIDQLRDEIERKVERWEGIKSKNSLFR